MGGAVLCPGDGNKHKKRRKEHRNAFWDAESRIIIEVARTQFLKLALGIHPEREDTSSK